jgi:hypothetical protein
MKQLPDAHEQNRHWWRRLALRLEFKLKRIQEDYDAVEAELKQLLAERARCTCQARNDTGGHQ